MVASLMTPSTSNSCHFRSTSMPSRSHPLVLKVEEGLKSIRDWQSTSSEAPSASMAESLSCGFDNFNVLDNSVEDLLRLPLTQQALYSANKKWVNDMLDDSLILLDVCSSIRNGVLHLKEQLHVLQSALRIRRGEPDVVSTIEPYLQARKKMKKEMSKCRRVLKAMEKRSIIFPCMTSSPDQNQDVVSVFNVLRELRAVRIAIFQTLALFLSSDARPKQRARHGSFVSKILGNNRVGCEGEEGISELGRVDVALQALHTHHSSKIAKEVHSQTAQKQLGALDICIKGLEVGSECMFRHLIQTRVSLLNLFTP